MKTVLLPLFLVVFPFVTFSQNNGLNQSIKTLQNFMNTHIPEMNSGIERFEILIKEDNLVIETFTTFEEGEDETKRSYIKEFDLKNEEVVLDKFRLSREEAKAYGYSVYWEVSVGSRFLLSNIESKDDAEKLVELLQNVKRQL